MRLRHAFNFCNFILLAVLAILAFIFGQQRNERNRWRQRFLTATAHLEDIRRRLPVTALQAPAELSSDARSEKSTTEDFGKTSTSSRRSANRARVIAERNQYWRRMSLLSGYDIPFSTLHLSPETVARAKEILLEPLGWPERTPTAEWKSRLTTRQAQLIALLGQDTFEELEAYQKENHFDWTIGSDLWDGGAPLTADQLHALTLAIVRTGYQDQILLSEPAAGMIPDSTTGLSFQDTTLLTATSRFLSPMQQTLLRQSLIDENRYNGAWRAGAEKARERLTQ